MSARIVKRSAIVWLLLISLFSLQAALAAHVCQHGAVCPHQQQDQAHQSQSHQKQYHKDGICHAHCSQGQQTLDTQPASGELQAPMGGYPLVILAPEFLNTTISKTIGAPAYAPPNRITSPPHSIQHCCFRL